MKDLFLPEEQWNHPRNIGIKEITVDQLTRRHIFNALDSFYISDGRNNQNGSSFDASSAGVFIGQGLRFNFSLGFQF